MLGNNIYKQQRKRNVKPTLQALKLHYIPMPLPNKKTEKILASRRAYGRAHIHLSLFLHCDVVSQYDKKRRLDSATYAQNDKRVLPLKFQCVP